MALHDWNNDGKKDMLDNVIEYEIYKKIINDKKKDDNNKVKVCKNSKKRTISSFSSILSIVLGLVFTSLLFTLLDANIDNIPVLLICFVWLINSSIIAFIATLIAS